MTVCLAMIVKDEEATIRRCLKSVEGLIDTWVIVDTGSTDATKRKIELWAKRAKIKGVFYERPWVGFGQNRTEMLELAKDAADHILMLDADWTISAPNGLFDQDADVHFIRHTMDGMAWDQQFIVRGGMDWCFDGAAGGAVHEYLVVPGDRKRGAVRDDVKINFHSSGGPTRSERDIRTMESWLVDHPEDVRTTFYLAQVLDESGNRARAAMLYERRFTMGDYPEEAYIAMYRAGLIHKHLGDWPRAVECFIKAWEYRSTRGEALYDLVSGLRERNHHQTAFALGQIGAKLKHPKSDQLFIYPAVYEWGLMHECAISAWWSGHIPVCRKLCKEMLEHRELPDHIRAEALANLEICNASSEAKTS